MLPDWSRDANAALDLLKDMPYHGVYHDGNVWELVRPDRLSETGRSACVGEVLSRLISEQFCVYTDEFPTAAMIRAMPDILADEPDLSGAFSITTGELDTLHPLPDKPLTAIWGQENNGDGI